MSLTRELPTGLLDQLRQAPIHSILVDLTTAAKDSKMIATPEFKKLVAYLLELADGRDRREPWTTRAGSALPVPKLRITLEKCFGVYADLHWFRLNKTTNHSGQPLHGLFERMAASLWRVKEADFAALLTALLGSSPDTAVLRLLHARGGRIKGMGLEVFSRLAYAYRRDLYFVLPKPWAETSGCLKYVGDDLRRYCGLCRNLRAVCDKLDVPADVRGSALQAMLLRKRPPAELLEALHEAIGPSLARFSALEPADAYKAQGTSEDPDSLPFDFAGDAIRRRRGRRELRDQLLRRYGDKCTFSGGCPRDLLEVAYLVPFPGGDVHAPENTLVLRTDLHTLWDLNLLGIDPSTMRISVAPRLGGTPYERLDGRALTSRADGSHLSREALAERWRMFASVHVTSGHEAVARSERKPEVPAATDVPTVELPERGRLAEQPRIAAEILERAE
jgi:hypothetical protein